MFFNLTLIPKIAPKSQKIDPKDQKKSAKEALNILMFESLYCLGLKIRLIFWVMIRKVKFLVVVVVVIVGGGGVGEVGLGVKLGGGG